ncbi:MAG: nif-specific transcriptional activator NifA [Nitrospirae bacterium]|nr:nif-specific transcriptional activator NifA [Nitrospirota bacterium]
MEKESKSKELLALLEVSRVLTESFDLEKNLTSAMRTLSELLEMQRGCVYLLDPVSGELTIVAAHGLSHDEIRKGKYRIGEGIVGRVIETGEPMFVPDIGDEPKFLNRTGSRPDKDGISFLCIPIELKSEMLGVISVDRIYSREHGGVDDDIRVLGIVSSLIAQFVGLWRIFREADTERKELRRQLKDRFSIPNLVGESQKFQSVLKMVTKVASTDATVLLLGESGTGKELIARTLHYQSPRAKGPFVAVNCAALPENLIEMELFGAEKGAFTGATERRIGRFERAKGGTIFLDEIGELPLSVQAKLLRVLQEKTFERLGSADPIKVDVRIIAATNRNLLDEVRTGKFREDLYWRLNVVSIRLPSLRERKEDIPHLVTYYLKRFNRKYKKNIRITDEAMKGLMEYSWPGNIRELANTLERMVIMAEDDLIRYHDIHWNSIYSKDTYASGMTSAEEKTLSCEVEAIERERIINALKENNFIQSRAARALGITPRQLGYRIKKYGIKMNTL